MSDRNQDILHQLIIKQNVNEQNLKKALSLTSRQLQYSIDQINDQLSELDIPGIEKKQGNYHFSSETVHLLKAELKKNSIFPVEDRIQIILLLILIREEEMSLDHFSIEIQVSKNTVLTDLKKCREYLSSYDLLLRYSRKKGYYIDGEEWHKRTVLLNAISILYRAYGETIINQLMGSNNKDKQLVKKNVIQIEKFLSIKYTDEDFYSLIYFTSAILKRIEKGHYVNGLYLLDPKEIMSTIEYQSLVYLISDFPEIPENERLYISLQLLGSNARNSRPLREEDLPFLANSLWEFLNEFEANTLMLISDKKELLKKLINHFKPAYYRIKYNLSFENILYDQITSQYHVLHDFVRQSIQPLENFFQTQISDEEVAYITLFVGGHLLEKDHNDFEDKVIKAVILCPNGVSMSKLMEKNLKAIFPEFLFYPANSVRDYQGFVLPHDLVFSTVPIESAKMVYVIGELLSWNEQLKLRRRVIKDVFKLDFDTIKSTEILNIVKKYADVVNERELLESLASLLIKKPSMNNDDSENHRQLNVIEILSKRTIKIIEDEKNWDDLLKEASRLLIKAGTIGEEFIGPLMEEYGNKPSYIMVKQRILLPHLSPDRINQKLGISILILKNGLMYQGEKMYIIALLTTPDRTSHLDILFDINRMAKDDAFIHKLKEAKSPKDAKEKICAFLKSREDDRIC